MNDDGMIGSFLRDPGFSGLGTWLGAIISIVSAVVAYKQARKAASMVKRLMSEQRRNCVVVADRHIARLDEILKPIVKNGLPSRGVKVSEVVADALYICHQLLSSPVDKILAGSGESIANIRNNLAQMVRMIDDIKIRSADISLLCDLQQSTLTEIQFLSRSCTAYLDCAATSEC